MKVLLFKFRPSSHSSDYTIVARFRTDRKAEEAYRELEQLIVEMDDAEAYGVDWSPGDAFYSLRGKTVYFSVYSSGHLGPAEDILSEAEDYNVYTNYQELTISVEVPKGLNFESAMLVLPREEAEMLKVLRERCEKVEVEEEGDRQFFIFKYKGDGIYDEFDNELILEDASLKLSGRPNWTVYLDE